MFYLKILKLTPLVAILVLTGNFIDCGGDYSEMSELSGTSKFVDWNSMLVTASAYNSLESQGVGNVNITAFGDTLIPGMKSIAVSQDLLEKGLSHNTKVKIQGLDGIYTVNDKMHPRWKNKIDIYMGTDRRKALEWGKRKVEICVQVLDLSE